MAFKIEYMIPAKKGWRVVGLDVIDAYWSWPIVAWATGTSDDDFAGIGSAICMDYDGVLHAVADWSDRDRWRIRRPDQATPTLAELQTWVARGKRRVEHSHAESA